MPAADVVASMVREGGLLPEALDSLPPADLSHRAATRSCIERSEMAENPYQSPATKPTAGRRKPAKSRWSLGVRVLVVNSLLLFLVAPIGCPCWLGPIGFIIQAYLLLLGIPVILFAPAFGDHQDIFLVAYIVNVAVVSYLMGYAFSFFVPAWRKRRRQGADLPDGNTEHNRCP
jgi:hypothetical protein